MHEQRPDAAIRVLLEEHWAASDRGDVDAEHAIYAEDAILDYPQSGERFRGRAKIAAQRGGHPAERRFTILRIRGGKDLWVNECVITYDGAPTYSISVMEFSGDLVTHETQYFADPFPAPASRAALAEPIPDHGRPGQPQAQPRNTGLPKPDRMSALPTQSREDTDAGWGESPDLDDTERLTRERPPHWE